MTSASGTSTWTQAASEYPAEPDNQLRRRLVVDGLRMTSLNKAPLTANATTAGGHTPLIRESSALISFAPVRH